MSSEHEPQSHPPPDSATLARLRWRCRRGMAEMDQLLLRFLECDYAQLSPQQRQDFDALLMMEDDQLWACFLGRQQAARPEWQRVVDLILRNSAA